MAGIKSINTVLNKHVAPLGVVFAVHIISNIMDVKNESAIIKTLFGTNMQTQGHDLEAVNNVG